MSDIPEDDRVGRQIADAHRTLGPGEVAAVIIKNLFEADGKKMPGGLRYVAIQTLSAALEVWRKQLLAGDNAETDKWREAYREVKSELEELKLHLAIMQKEGKLG